MRSVVKSGVRTSEFWVTAIVNVAGAIVALLAAYGMVRHEDAPLWLALVQAVALAVVPLVMAYVSGRYIKSRTAVKIRELYLDEKKQPDHE